MSLKISIGTYNLNQQLLDQELDLTSWLFSFSKSLLEKPDIIAIGFQEFNEYPNAFLNINNEIRIKHCEEIIEKAIYKNTKERYVRIIRSSLVGLALIIYVRDGNGSEGLVSRIKGVELEQVGIGPIWAGNKGAIAVRLIISTISNIEQISVCFVCAHLAPHSHNVMKRNKNFKSIIGRVIFTNMFNKEHITIYDNDYVFFFGDLNYRIEIGYLTKANLMNLLDTNQHQSVIAFDQLNIEKGRGQVFNGFQEGEIKFSPTYKYYIGNKNSFNVSKRTPGWCDRILYYSRSIEAEQIILHQYISNNDYIISDHKPVSALFTINYESLTTLAPNNSNFTNFEIDEWRNVKKTVGNVATRIFGLLWWLFGTKRGVLIIGISVGSYFIKKLID